MGLAYEFSDSILCFRSTGDFQYSDGLAVMREGFARAAADSDGRKWNLLFDVTESGENRSSEELRGIAALIDEYKKHLTGYSAVVATDPLMFGLSRMFGVFMQGFGFENQVFTSMEDALHWLGSQGSTDPPHD